MRRRTNTQIHTQQPKQIDRFKKRSTPKILFAEQVNYSMQMTQQNQGSEKSSQNSDNTSAQNIEQKQRTEKRTQNLEKKQQVLKHKQQQANSNQEKQKQQKISNQEKMQQKSRQPAKKQIIIIGDSIVYEQKTKGFKKSNRRRYSHKYQLEYMTY